MSDPISSVSKSCFLSIHDLRRISNTLDFSARTIATSLIHSELDYCNFLFLNLPQSQLGRLKFILNSSPQAVSKTPKFAHITQTAPSQSSPLSLHLWIVNQAAACSIHFGTCNSSTRQVRSYHTDYRGVALAADREAHTFKLATLSYNIKSTGQPVYLRELLSDYQPVCTLRSSSIHLLTVSVAETVLATRGFIHSAVHFRQSGTVCLIVFANLPTLIFINVRLRHLTLHSSSSSGQSVSTNSIYATHGT